MAPQMDGRVFSRLQQFAALHGDFQEEVKELEVYLTANKNDIFGLHHANLVKSIRSIRAKPLVEKIDAWLQNKNAPVAAAATATTTAAEPESVPVPAPATEQVTPAATTEEVTPAPTQEVTSEAPAATTETSAATTETAAAAATPTETPEEIAAKAAAAAEASAARLAHAKKLLEALVLKGFVTPYKEQEKLPNFAAAASTAAAATAAADATSETTESKPPAPLVFKDSELLIPVAPEVADDASVLTVWQLVDGAVYAGVLKRKAGFLAPLTQGKDVYAVINKRLKSLTLFETDVGRHPIVHFAVGEDEANAPTVHVSFDKAHFVHGIKVWNDVASELLNAANKLERETIVHALVGVGLQYREEPSINVDAIKSIYELKDVDIDGNDVTFDKYKGKVLLVVNVSSACGLTPINYPELVTLDEKYREMGLEVLAFPCNQFWGQEPGTHDEIKTFVQQYNANFTFFSKGDVNGTETRPVFAYLKAKQQGEGGDYIKWNFGKFLVDRNGQPVARYGPMEKPLSFESEIVKLLSAEADPEAVAVAEVDVKEVKTTTVVTETTTVETTTAVAAAVATEETLVGTEAIAAEDPVVVTETTTTTVVTETPTETTTVVTESPPVVVEEEKAAAAVAPQDTVVKTLSVEDQPLPVEETKPAPETKVEAEATPAASAAGEDAVSTTTTTSTTTSKTEETPEVVQGFTPGNEPVAAP